MKKIYLLLIALTFSAVGFGQTVIESQTFSATSLPTGWTQNAMSFPGGYALFGTINSSKLTSPSFPVSAYSSIVLNFEAAKIGTQGNVWSNGVVANATPAVIYCASESTDATYEHIGRVRLNTIDNVPGGDNGASNYTNYTAISTTLDRGTQYPITINAIKSTADAIENFSVWIDYNQNGDFSDPGEQVFVQNNTIPQVSGNFTVPNQALSGATRMRVSMKYIGPGASNSNPLTPCELFEYGEVEDYTVNIAQNTLYLYNMGWTPADPSGIATSTDVINVQEGNAEITINTQIGNVTVEPLGALTVNTGVTLNVAGALNLQSNKIRYSSLMAEGTISGAVNYDRHVNGGTNVRGRVGAGANDLISSPLVSNQNFGAFAASNPNIKFDTRPAPIGNPNTKLFGPFDKATGSYLLWNSVTNAAEALVPGVGYRAASTDNGGFLFRGTVNQGIVTNNITYTTTTGVPFKEWNLVGNPYPAYINVGDFLNYLVYDDVDPALDVRNVDLLVNANAAIYGYDGDSSDGWIIWNLNTPTRNMTPGQGFLVAANPAQVAAYDLTFTPSMRRIGNTDDFILGRSANTNNSHLRLRAKIGTGNYHTDFYFNDNSSSGLDRGYDAAVYGNVAGSKSIFSRLVENNTGIDMAIQSLATSALGSDIIVPLGIKTTQGQQVTVSISESDLPSNIEVYLEDNVTGTFTLLNNSDYIFTPSATLNSVGRFFLRFSEQTLSTPDSELNSLQIYTTTAPRTLFVKGQLSDVTNITIYDVQGRLVSSSQLEASSNANQIDVSNLSSGVYVVKLNNTTQQKTQKVILK